MKTQVVINILSSDVVAFSSLHSSTPENFTWAFGNLSYIKTTCDI